MTHHRDHGKLEQRRLKAAKLFAQGRNPSEVARFLGVRRQSAHEWRRRWLAGGPAALHSTGAAGPKARLRTAQTAAVTAALLQGPEAHGYATAVWTLPRVAKLIAAQTGEHYHPGHVWRLLRGLGFSCQRPTRQAIERDEPAIARWKTHGWPRLKKKPGGKAAPSSSSMRAG